MSLKEIIPFVFLDVAIVIVAARLMGRLFVRLRQPAVIGEILAGILLGPTLLGLFPGDLHLVLFPPDVRPYLSVIAQLGLVLFMFIVGLEVDLSLIRERRRTATAVSLASIVLPFGLGVLLATTLHDDHGVVDGVAIPFLAFALFLGVAMSITAFPVLARILTGRGMHRTPTGVLSLACAAIDDVVAWSLLAVVVAVAVGGSLSGVALILGLTVVYAIVMFGVVRPLLGRLVERYRRSGRLTPDVLAVVLVGVLLSAWVTELIGVHAIFGAFVFGAIMPRSEPLLTRSILQQLEQVSMLLLLPVFFVVAGLQVDVRGVGADGLVELVLILLVAIGGKFVGAFIAARLQRVPQRQAIALGLLMNTRGLTEIVILQVGLQLGVLDQELFTLMVIMALVTTIMTEPLLRIFYPDRIVAREIAAAERAELGTVDAFTVLVAVPDGAPADDPARLARLGADLLGREEPARVVLALLAPQPPVPLELASGFGTDLATIAAAGAELRALARTLEADGISCSVVARFAADPVAEIGALAATLPADVVLVTEPDAGPVEAGPVEAGARTNGSGVATLVAPVTALPDVGEAALVVVRLPWAGGRDPVEPGGRDPVEPGGRDPVEPGGRDPVEPGPGGVGVLTDGDGAGRSAVRLAAHVALRRHATVSVGAVDRRSPRRAAAAVQALARRGLAAADRADGAADDVLLLPEDAAVPVVGEGTTVVRVRAAAVDADEDLVSVVGRIAVPEPITGPSRLTRLP